MRPGFAQLSLTVKADTMPNKFTPSNATKASQQGAILAALRVGPLTTVTSREALGVLHPAGRIMELKRLGFTIETRKVRRFDADGRPHTVAEYVLIEGADHA